MGEVRDQTYEEPRNNSTRIGGHAAGRAVVARDANPSCMRRAVPDLAIGATGPGGDNLPMSINPVREAASEEH
jgi:hypothetical protein